MEILEKSEVFTDDEDDEPVFSHSIVVYRDSGVLNIGELKSRVFTSGPIDFSSIQSTRIPVNEIHPPYTEGFTKCTGHEKGEVFIKRPSLLDYTPGTADYFRDILLHEAEIGEVLRKSPHPHIASYLGCAVDDGKIVGLCWQNYRLSLKEKMGQLSSVSEVKLLVNGIVQGINHIHSLGYCHNDINPSNIRFADDGKPVIIDFDSCELTGKPLHFKAGTMGWCNEETSLSLPENDFYGIRAVERFLLAHVGQNCQS
ncbi:Serine/threonine-protein kinase 16 [Gracilariopsis chorda]|uniref:Serine/threonine-protein kinase 16 n=1 Tax=Gracilariopsis chorda TaxID=448386 RepID=A0A2V3IU26_9FLOR|nr:Serine/threonine-protein kinase 16 [Gracilariopsis chorda]|eukprot:PXF45624.1 Serine/threonine-protein kinase 16 [Gracilariopsis chorda]